VLRFALPFVEVCPLVEVDEDRLLEIKVGRRPRGIVFTPDGSRAFVSNENDANVSIIDVAKLEAVGTIPIGEPPKRALTAGEFNRGRYLPRGRASPVQTQVFSAGLELQRHAERPVHRLPPVLVAVVAKRVAE